VNTATAAPTTAAAPQRANPLLSASPLPFQAPPFDKIQDGDYLPAFAQAMAEHLEQINAIADSTEPVRINEDLLDRLKGLCRRLGYEYRLLPSGAGHDAQILSAVCPVAMIFIPSIDGLSHVPEEAINFEDLEKAANLLLQALIDLASE